jgi:cell wall-associated NlpC family hydrolase
VTSTSKGISGLAVAALAFGAIFIWAGVENQGLINSLRYLAMGQAIPKGEQKQLKYNPTRGPLEPDGQVTGGGNQNVVSIAASYKGHPYVFGGGHGTVCPSGGMDCSGYVSCVLNKAGLMKGTLTTDGFARWGIGVPFDQRQPGDIVVWTGGPGGGHMGIIADGKTMWHSPCTGCGGVQKASYGKTRTMRPSNVRRARGRV